MRSQTGPSCCKLAFTLDAVLYATLDAALFIFHKLALFFVYVAAAITVAALATVFVHTLDAALPAGFAPAVFAPTLDATHAAALAAGFPAAPAAALLCRNEYLAEITRYVSLILFMYNFLSIIKYILKTKASISPLRTAFTSLNVIQNK